MLNIVTLLKQQNYMHLDLLERKNKKHRPEPFLHQIREDRFNNRYSLSDRTHHYEALNDPYTSYYFANPSVKQHLRCFRRAIREQPNEVEKNRINKLITLRIKEKFTSYISPKTLIYEQELSSLELNALAKKSSISLHKKKSKQSLASHTTDQDHIIKALPRKNRYFPSVKPEGLPLSGTGSQQLESPPQQAANNEPIVTDFSPRAVRKDKKSNSSTKKHSYNQKQTEVLLSPSAQNNKTGSQKTQMQIRMKNTIKQNDQAAFANRLAQELHKKKHQKWIKFLQQKKIIIEKLAHPDSPATVSPSQHI